MKEVGKKILNQLSDKKMKNFDLIKNNINYKT